MMRKYCISGFIQETFFEYFMLDSLHRNKNNANAYCHELAFQEIFLKVFLVLSSFVFAEFDR